MKDHLYLTPHTESYYSNVGKHILEIFAFHIELLFGILTWLANYPNRITVFFC